MNTVWPQNGVAKDTPVGAKRPWPLFGFSLFIHVNVYFMLHWHLGVCIYVLYICTYVCMWQAGRVSTRVVVVAFRWFSGNFPPNGSGIGNRKISPVYIAYRFLSLFRRSIINVDAVWANAPVNLVRDKYDPPPTHPWHGVGKTAGEKWKILHCKRLTFAVLGTWTKTI